MSVVSGKGPAQAVDSLMVGDIVMALETWAANLGCLLNSGDDEMGSGHCARSDLFGMVVPRNSRTSEPLLWAQVLLGVLKIQFRSVPWLEET